MYKFLLILFSLGMLSAMDLEHKPLEPVRIEAKAEMTLNGQKLSYQVVSGTMILENAEGKTYAAIGYTAYFLEGSEKSRPLAFCFNGGPGAASVWLNTGLMGPKRIDGEDVVFQDPPYALVDNESTFLNQTDMVFIDPVSTGFSRPVTELHGVDEDVNAMADFVRQFTGEFKRFDSPKYFVGESYGGIRAAKVAYKLHEDYGYYLNGILFVSPGIDMQTLLPGGCNDLPYQLALPSMTAVAHYHKKISGDLSALLKEAEEFAENGYAHALNLGDKITSDERAKILERLSYFTGLPKALVDRLNLRVRNYRFFKELMQPEGKIIGHFDGRILGADTNEYEIFSSYDPSLNDVMGAVTATFSQYMLQELNWPENKDYRVLAPIPAWNWGKGNQFASCLTELKSLMALNPKLKIVVLKGLYDLATPYYSTDYALNHLNLPQGEGKRIRHFLYPAGHMMYYNKQIRENIRKDINILFN